MSESTAAAYRSPGQVRPNTKHLAGGALRVAGGLATSSGESRHQY